MNRKIYFNNNYLLLTEEKFQQTENQVIIESDNLDDTSLNTIIRSFLRETGPKSYVFITKNLNFLFERIKTQFRFIEAAGGLIKKNDTYLFIYRLGKWDLPKGKIDAGETPEQAAVRECMEECAIQGLSINEELPSSYHIYEHKGAFVLKRTYWYLMSTSYNAALVPQTEENIEKAEWLGLNEIKSTVFSNTYPSIRDLLLHNFGMN